jgi:hypothetical protein
MKSSRSRFRWVTYCLIGLNMLAWLMIYGCVPVITTEEKPSPTETINLSVTPSKEMSTLESLSTTTSISALTPDRQPTSASLEIQPLKQVTITGWFTTIWNEEPHYSISDEQGQTTQLLLDDEAAKPLGGPLELDRKRVTIVGEIKSISPKIVRVLSIKFAIAD